MICLRPHQYLLLKVVMVAIVLLGLRVCGGNMTEKFIDARLEFGGKAINTMIPGVHNTFSHFSTWASDETAEVPMTQPDQKFLILPIVSEYFHYPTKKNTAGEGFTSFNCDETQLEQMGNKIPGAPDAIFLHWKKVGNLGNVMSNFTLYTNEGIYFDWVCMSKFKNSEEQKAIIEFRIIQPEGAEEPNILISVYPEGFAYIWLYHGQQELGQPEKVDWYFPVPKDKVNISTSVRDGLKTNFYLLPIGQGVAINGTYIEFPSKGPDGKTLWPHYYPSYFPIDITKPEDKPIPVIIRHGAKITATFYSVGYLVCAPLLFQRVGTLYLGPFQASENDIYWGPDFSNVQTSIRADVPSVYPSINVDPEISVQVKWPLFTTFSENQGYDSVNDNYQWWSQLRLVGCDYGGQMFPSHDDNLCTWTPIVYSVEAKVVPVLSDYQLAAQPLYTIEENIESINLSFSPAERDFTPSECIFILRCRDEFWPWLDEGNLIFRLFVKDVFQGRFFTQTSRKSSSGFGEMYKEIRGLDAMKRLSNTYIPKRYFCDGKYDSDIMQELIEEIAGMKLINEFNPKDKIQLPRSPNKMEPYWSFYIGTSIADACRQIAELSGGILIPRASLNLQEDQDVAEIVYMPHPRAKDQVYVAGFSTQPGIYPPDWDKNIPQFPIMQWEEEKEDTYRTVILVMTRAFEDSPLGAAIPYHRGELIQSSIALPDLENKIGESRYSIHLAPQLLTMERADSAAQWEARSYFESLPTFRFTTVTIDDTILQVRPYQKIALSIHEYNGLLEENLIIKAASFNITRFGIQAQFQATRYPMWTRM